MTSSNFNKKDCICIIVLFILLLIPNISALIFAADLHGNWIKTIGYMGIVGVGLLLPALVLKARTYFIFEGIFSFLWMPIDVASLYFNKQSASKLFLGIIFATDWVESTEFLLSIWHICLLLVVLWGIYIYLCIKVSNQPLIPRKFRIWGLISTIAVVLATYVSLSFLIRKINPNFTTQQVMSQTWDKFGMKFLKIYPYNLYINTYHLWQDKRDWKKAEKELESFSFGISQRDSLDHTLYVLYIGEATRYDHLTINGYTRNTTPHLSEQTNLISYSSIYTLANLTNYSIPFLLTRATPNNMDVMQQEKSISEAFKEAGYKTAFISKNSYTPFTMRIMNNCDYGYIFSRGIDAVDSYDIELVNQLKENIDYQGQFVILHSLGSHYKYNLRYPEEDNYYTPSLMPNDGYAKLTEENKEILINAYDNSVRYTDYVLGELITWADSLNQEVVIMYISDHGESFWDDERKLSLHGTYEICEEQYHVPTFIWYSDEYQQRFPQKVAYMQQNQDVVQTAECVFHTLLDIANIQEIVDSTKSLCSQYIQTIDSFPVLNGAGEVKTYVIK